MLTPRPFDSIKGVSRTCPSCGKSYDDSVFFCGEDGQIVVQDQPPEDFDARLGKQLGGYIAAARVADGAMGRVYEGRHPETKERVAIKVLHDSVARDHVSVERFKREYETAQELDHPHIVKVLEFGETGDSSYFMTMEFLEGEELSKAMAGDVERMTPERVVRMVCQIAAALDCAHSYGFVHRDLKPDNVFLCKSDSGDDVRLLDFGSVKLQMEMGAKLTAVGTTLGSPYYMSPEQAMGATDLDQRTDVFALGAILYEMLTGQVAFEGANVALILMKIMNENPPAPSTQGPWSASLDEVVDKALRKEKADRYDSAGRFATALVRAFGLTGEGGDWAECPEPEIATALAKVEPPPAEAQKSEPRASGAGAGGGPSVTGLVATPALGDAAVGGDALGSAVSMHAVSTTTIPAKRGAAIWGIAAAGLALVAVLAYLMR